MRRLIDRATSADGEDGFTIIEVLVAAFVLVLAAMAVFIGFAGAIHGIQRGREMQQGVSVAQREMERIRIEGFDEVGLTSPTVSIPATGETRTLAPRVSEGGGEFNMNRTGAPNYKPFVAGGLEVEKREVTSVGGSKMIVFRFVVCEREIGSECVAKRIIVDVVPVPADNAGGYQHSYYELQSTIVKP